MEGIGFGRGNVETLLRKSTPSLLSGGPSSRRGGALGNAVH